MNDPFEYEPLGTLFHDDFSHGFEKWRHEGIGDIGPGPDGGMLLQCIGSRQSGQGCMAFCTETFPDQISVSYDVIVKSHGGLVINYVAMRGLLGEDMFDDASLEPRTGIMAKRSIG